MKPREILSAVLAFLKLSVRSPTPPRLSRFPALSPLCSTDNASEVKQLVVTEGHVLQATLLGGQQASSRELGHQNAINLGHFNLLRPAIFACYNATTTHVAPLQ